jgi:hypothetical protein
VTALIIIENDHYVLTIVCESLSAADEVIAWCKREHIIDLEGRREEVEVNLYETGCFCCEANSDYYEFVTCDVEVRK